LTSNGITNTGNISTTGNLSAGGNASVAGDASVGGTLDMTNGQIKNVANGTASGDAVNFGQLQDTRKKLEAGIASTAAMANIPLVDPGKTFALGVGMGSHGGQGAFAVGGSYRFNATTVIRGSIAGGSTGKATAGVGVGISW
jgi:autotransporter adhesin